MVLDRGEGGLGAALVGHAVRHSLRLVLDRDPVVPRVDVAVVTQHPQLGRLEAADAPAVNPLAVGVDRVEGARADTTPRALQREVVGKSAATLTPRIL